MGGACSTHGMNEKCRQNLTGKLYGRVQQLMLFLGPAIVFSLDPIIKKLLLVLFSKISSQFSLYVTVFILKLLITIVYVKI
jgi:hypothetical protein